MQQKNTIKPRWIKKLENACACYHISRMSGVCAKHQRDLAIAIKRARIVALLPYVAD